jgi:hypothetical protein
LLTERSFVFLPAQQVSPNWLNTNPFLDARTFSKGCSHVSVPNPVSHPPRSARQCHSPTNDHEVEDFIYDAIELLPGTSEVEVRCEGGRATLTGSVQHKRLKRDVGEIAWAIPALNDVQNNVTITSRRRSRIGREVEAGSSPSTRKQP